MKMSKGKEFGICVLCAIPMFIWSTEENFGWWWVGCACVAAAISAYLEEEENYED